ncbi:MAG: SGNH/GDSL hydrolase family protein [Vicinamibacterales bacterium]|jgi:lysophospholipase L1-like esterase
MRKIVPVLACCALLAACGGSTTTGPSKTPTLSRTRFLAFGDSLTSGEVTVPVGVVPEWPGVGGAGQPSTRMILVPAASYPTQLLSMLQARYAPQAAAVAMTNAGKPNETAQLGLVRLPTVLAESQPEVLLLMEGVNGLFIAGPDLSADFVRDMVQLAKSRARVFVASMLPTIPGRRNSQVVFELEKLNSNLRSMAADEGVVFIDLYSPMLPEAATLIGIDGLHPTEAGYRRMADIFFASIQANLEVK